MQWSVLLAFVAKHDSDVNIAMAEDAKINSSLMKKMTGVSIIFLPATSLATFFSMMFFQVEHGALRMNTNIWVYFASTSAISLAIAAYFRFGKKGKALGEEVINKLRTSRRRSLADKQDDSKV